MFVTQLLPYLSTGSHFEPDMCYHTFWLKSFFNVITAGVLAGIWPCGVVTTLEELFWAEAKCQVQYMAVSTAFSMLILLKHPQLVRSMVVLFWCITLCYMYIHTWKSEFLVYDDGCHLKKFATNPVRSALTETTEKIAGMDIVIDKMHFRGHVDQWCKHHCNPHDYDELQKVHSIHVPACCTL